MQTLLAEDEDQTAEFVEREFVELGHVVFRVGDGLKAVYLAASEESDAMIFDRAPPRCDVMTVLRGGHCNPVILLKALGRSRIGSKGSMPDPTTIRSAVCRS